MDIFSTKIWNPTNLRVPQSKQTNQNFFSTMWEYLPKTISKLANSKFDIHLARALMVKSIKRRKDKKREKGL